MINIQAAIYMGINVGAAAYRVKDEIAGSFYDFSQIYYKVPVYYKHESTRVLTPIDIHVGLGYIDKWMAELKLEVANNEYFGFVFGVKKGFKTSYQDLYNYFNIAIMGEFFYTGLPVEEYNQGFLGANGGISLGYGAAYRLNSYFDIQMGVDLIFRNGGDLDNAVDFEGSATREFFPGIKLYMGINFNLGDNVAPTSL